MKTVAVYSVKGGVGKTSAAVNLAWSASRSHRTLLWDLDPQGGATYLLRAKPKKKVDAHDLVRGKADLADVIRATADPRLDVIPAHDSYRAIDLELDATKNPERRLAKMITSQSSSYDVGILDCPPGMSLLSESILTAADVLVVPLPPSPLAMRSLEQVTAMVSDLARRRPKILDIGRADGCRAGSDRHVRPPQRGCPCLRPAVGRGERRALTHAADQARGDKKTTWLPE